MRRKEIETIIRDSAIECKLPKKYMDIFVKTETKIYMKVQRESRKSKYPGEKEFNKFMSSMRKPEKRRIDSKTLKDAEKNFRETIQATMFKFVMPLDIYGDIFKYLYDHPFLLPVLDEAHKYVEKVMKPEPNSIQLSIQTDWEGVVNLYIDVHTPYSIETALKLCSKLFNVWLKYKSAKIRKHITCCVKTNSKD